MYKKVEKDKKPIRLTNFPRNHNLFVLFPEWKYPDSINDVDFQRSIINTIQNREDLQRYLWLLVKKGKVCRTKLIW